MTDRESRERLIELVEKAKQEYAGDVTDHTETDYIVERLLNNGVAVLVRCKDCIYAVELDKHCDISRTAYRHCNLLRGDETKYVWHKYKKYYKDYSIVDLDGYCDSGELKEREKV